MRHHVRGFAATTAAGSHGGLPWVRRNGSPTLTEYGTRKRRLSNTALSVTDCYTALTTRLVPTPSKTGHIKCAAPCAALNMTLQGGSVDYPQSTKERRGGGKAPLIKEGLVFILKTVKQCSGSAWNCRFHLWIIIAFHFLKTRYCSSTIHKISNVRLIQKLVRASIRTHT